MTGSFLCSTDTRVKKRALAEHQEREHISCRIEHILPIPAITRDYAPAVNNGPLLPCSPEDLIGKCIQIRDYFFTGEIEALTEGKNCISPAIRKVF